jgi:hypothetical protein
MHTRLSWVSLASRPSYLASNFGGFVIEIASNAQASDRKENVTTLQGACDISRRSDAFASRQSPLAQGK